MPGKFRKLLENSKSSWKNPENLLKLRETCRNLEKKKNYGKILETGKVPETYGKFRETSKILKKKYLEY